MKVVQDTQEELLKLLNKKNETAEIDITLGSTIETVTIETYDIESQINEESCDSYNQTKISDNTALDNKIDYSPDKFVPDFHQASVHFSDILSKTSHLKDQSNIKSESEIFSKKYSCNECGDVFLMKLGFTHHMLQKHSICISERNIDQYSANIKITVPVDFSDNGFQYVKKIPLQPKKQHQFQCQICKNGFANRLDLKSHYNIHKTFKCDQCDAAFIKNSYLKDHLLMHSTEKKYICDLCGKAFKFRNGLAVHRTTHSNHKAHICEACGQGFKAKTTLLIHIKLKHSLDEKKFACSECNLVFKMKSWLDKHFKRKHTKNRSKDFICSVCGISYLDKTTLTRHTNDKHLGKGKRFSCQICEKSYTMKNKLFDHMQIKHSTV